MYRTTDGSRVYTHAPYTRKHARRARNGTYVGQARGTSKAAVEIVQNKSGFRAREGESLEGEGEKKRVENWHARYRADRCGRPAAACKRGENAS